MAKAATVAIVPTPLYQLTLNEPHNGCLAGLFPEVTHAGFARRELECTIEFNQEEFQSSSISPWEIFAAYY